MSDPSCGELPMLDTEEYFHLALHASATGERHACLMYLSEVLQREPRNARAWYLRAIQHAEVGLIDRAVRELRDALALEPSLEMARFQLGLLLLERQDGSGAHGQFSQLSASADLTLQECARAMQALCENDVAAARAQLERIVAHNPSNPPLVALVQRLLARIAAAHSSDSAPRSEERVALGAYGRQT